MLLPELKFNLIVILARMVRGNLGCYTEGEFPAWRWEKSGPCRTCLGDRGLGARRSGPLTRELEAQELILPCCGSHSQVGGTLL